MTTHHYHSFNALDCTRGETATFGEIYIIIPTSFLNYMTPSIGLLYRYAHASWLVMV